MVRISLEMFLVRYHIFKQNYNLEERPDDGECSVDEDSSLSDDQEKIVQLQRVSVVILQLPHLTHPHHHRGAGQTVHGELGEGGHLDREESEVRVGVRDEDKEDDERDDGDGEDDDATEQTCAGLPAVNTVATWSLGSNLWQITAKHNSFGFLIIKILTLLYVVV